MKETLNTLFGGSGAEVEQLEALYQFCFAAYADIADLLNTEKYTWELPPSGNRLNVTTDPDYYRYVCRTGAIGSAPTNIELILSKAHQHFNARSNTELFKIKESLIKLIDSKKFRTQSEMDEIHKLVKTSVSIIQSEIAKLKGERSFSATAA